MELLHSVKICLGFHVLPQRLSHTGHAGFLHQWHISIHGAPLSHRGIHSPSILSNPVEQTIVCTNHSLLQMENVICWQTWSGRFLIALPFLSRTAEEKNGKRTQNRFWSTKAHTEINPLVFKSPHYFALFSSFSFPPFNFWSMFVRRNKMGGNSWM